MEYYSAIKTNEIVSFAGKLIELEIIMLSEISQVQKAKYWGTKIRGIVVQSQPRLIAHEILSQKNPSQKKKKKGLVEWLRV
jgi:hypothetical protein